MNANSTPTRSGHTASQGPKIRRRWTIVALLLIVLIVGTVMFVYAHYPIVNGYAHHSYIPDGDYTEGEDVPPEPTDKGAQSKLWYHDGYWWGVMYNPEAGEYRIYKLTVSTQEWTDTGVRVDTREESRADVLWDAANNKLYIATHIKQQNPSPVNNNPANWAYLQQYHYNASNDTWVVDDNGIEDGSGVITVYIVESLVIDQDSTGRLWATYVVREDLDQFGRPTVPGGGIAHYYVAVSTTDDPSLWDAPVVWNTFPEAEVSVDDISSLVAFTDADGPKVGLIWSNERLGEFYFYSRNDSDPVGTWTVDNEFEALKAASGPISADDHINFAVTEGGDVLAIVKTSANLDPANEDVLIGIFARDTDDGSWSWHEVSEVDSVDTRPIVLVNETTDTVYAFSVSTTGGGDVCYQDAPIPDNLSTLAFAPGGCDPSDPFGNETIFISHYDGGFENINSPTSTKQRLTNASGMVVLASDDMNGYVYVHNMEGGGAPVQPPPATPTPGAFGGEAIFAPVFLKQ